MTPEENMEKTPEVQAQEIPTLSQEQKLTILLAQRSLLTAKMVYDDAVRKYQDSTTALNDAAKKLAKELSVAEDEYVLDMDNLVLLRK